MTTLCRLRAWALTLTFALLALFGGVVNGAGAQGGGAAGKTRLAVIGLDHDHVWSLLKDVAGEPSAELIAIAESDAGLVARAQKQVPAGVKFYTDYVAMLDEAKPDGVIVTTSNDKHLEILRQCAKRHIHYSAEKPMAVNAADAREMERLANEAKIKLMVNYWNAWVAPTHELFRRVRAGEEWRRGDYGFWLLRGGVVDLVEGAAFAGLCDYAEAEGGPKQQGG